MQELVKTSWPQPGLAIVTLTDPNTPNHNVTWKAIGQLADALEAARVAGARVVVLASGVEGFWLSHAHLGNLRTQVLGESVEGDPTGWFRAPRELCETDVVSIAAISGDTSGGGCELGWACDLRIAEAGVRFSQPEVIMGLGTGIGGAARLRRIIGRTLTAEMILTGLPLSAERLYELGGVNRVVPRGKSLATATAWGRRLAELPPASIAGLKRMLVQGEDLPLPAALENDQAIAQTLFRSPEGLGLMQSIQQRYDRGEPMTEVLWPGSPTG
jgi:enoyl-CoA hydratase/carnithine racemase